MTKVVLLDFPLIASIFLVLRAHIKDKRSKTVVKRLRLSWAKLKLGQKLQLKLKLTLGVEFVVEVGV